MNFIEVVKAAMEGHDIQRRDWRIDNRKITAETLTGGGHKVLILWNDENVGEFQGDVSDFLATDWEIVSEPPKTMGFIEAVTKMKDNKTVRRLHWKNPHYKCRALDGGGVIYASWTEEVQYRQENGLSVEDIEATDWIVID